MAVCTTDKPEVLDDGKVYVYTDDLNVNHYREGTPLRCGEWGPNGGREYCDRHNAELTRRYPQGWQAYPGDTCEHGRYIGGCGPDYMCPECEA
jgi:hypothetical protein